MHRHKFRLCVMGTEAIIIQTLTMHTQFVLSFELILFLLFSLLFVCSMPNTLSCVCDMRAWVFPPWSIIVAFSVYITTKKDQRFHTSTHIHTYMCTHAHTTESFSIRCEIVHMLELNYEWILSMPGSFIFRSLVITRCFHRFFLDLL